MDPESCDNNMAAKSTFELHQSADLMLCDLGLRLRAWVEGKGAGGGGLVWVGVLGVGGGGDSQPAWESPEDPATHQGDISLLILLGRRSSWKHVTDWTLRHNKQQQWEKVL